MLKRDLAALETLRAEQGIEAELNSAKRALSSFVPASLFTGGSLGQVLTNNGDGTFSWAPSGGGASVKAGELVVTVPGPAGRFEHEETLAAVGVTGSMHVLLSLAPHFDSDENNEQALDLMGLAGQAGTDAVTVRMSFGSLTSGPIRINYMAV